MKNFNTESDNEFIEVISNLSSVVSDTINDELLSYYNELKETETSKDDLFLKVLQKSNSLVLMQAIKFSNMFSSFNNGTRKELAKRLKELITSDS